MAGLRLSLLLCLVLRSYGNTAKQRTINISNVSWRSIPNYSSIGRVSTIDQDSGNNQMCFPNSWNVLMKQQMIIAPKNKCSPVEILQCYCLMSESTAHDVDTEYMYFGKCFYGCFNGYIYYKVQLDEQMEKGTCNRFNRKSILCGQCEDGYGPAAYSFSLKCVECGNSTHWTQVPLYILVAYGPLTVFLGVIVVFTVSVNSAPLHGWILVCQLLSNSTYMRIFTLSSDNLIFVHILGSIYGIWNLDFFRSVYSPFCLHLSLTTLQVMSLDYFIAAYPLALIFGMYLLVDMYSHNCHPVVIMLRPFHFCFTCFRYQLNIKTSLVDAFGTFFSLSYIKFCSTTFDLLTATQVWDLNGTAYRVYYDGTMEAFKDRHIPYAVLGVLVGLFCNVLPLVLILLYSFHRTHVVLNCLPLSVRTMLFPFMDNVLACYKDGTNGTRNCRFFGAVYHLAYICILSGFAWTRSILVLGVNTFMCIVIGIFIAIIQPYRAKVYNIVDTVLILSVGLGFASSISFATAVTVDPQNTYVAYAMGVFPTIIIPLFYFIGYLGIKIGKRCIPSLCSFCVKVILFCKSRKRQGAITENTALLH